MEPVNQFVGSFPNVLGPVNQFVGSFPNVLGPVNQFVGSFPNVLGLTNRFIGHFSIADLASRKITPRHPRAIDIPGIPMRSFVEIILIGVEDILDSSIYL